MSDIEARMREVFSQERQELPGEFLAVFERFLDSMPEDVYQEFLTKDEDHWVEYFIVWCGQMESLCIEAKDKH